MQQAAYNARHAWWQMTGWARPRSLLLACLFLFAVPFVFADQSVDAYGNAVESHFGTEPYPTSNQTISSNGPTPTQWKVIDLENALKHQTVQMAEGPEVDDLPVEMKLGTRGIVVIIAFGLVGILVIRIGVEALDKKVNAMANSSAAAEKIENMISEDEKAFAEFVATFHGTPPAESEGSGKVKEFITHARKLLEDMRYRMQEIESAVAGPARTEMLLGVQRELHELKGEAAVAELHPAWQMAAAVESLVKQLADDDACVTTSALRTAGGGMIVLNDLCVPGLKQDFLTSPPFKLLTVDDDVISRTAVALSLKKALNKPDMAGDGIQALSMATNQPYDVIFLDVQMPGMDGFELCTKIHELTLNRDTPVVFVTSNSDFAAREKSTESGGHDLIGKPFLTFEIAVKALSLAVPGRLRALADAEAKANEKANGKSSAVNGKKVHYRSRPKLVDSSRMADLQQLPVAEFPQNNRRAEEEAAANAEPEDPAQAYLLLAAAQLRPLQKIVSTILDSTDKQIRNALLTDLCVKLRAWLPEGDLLKDHPAIKLATMVEGLIKKQLEKEEACNTSTLLTVSDAVSMLSELCQPGIKRDLAHNPPVRLLAVDDDPISRRAISFALHLTFPKPDVADCGDDALKLASEKEFDVIFMDVQMPGMDGFTACTKIRETEINRFTPIVFVTAHGDVETRARATLSGGSDLVGKPILTAEIGVKALTFALRSRLQKSKIPDSVSVADEVEKSKGSSQHERNRDRHRRSRSEKQARRV